MKRTPEHLWVRNENGELVPEGELERKYPSFLLRDFDTDGGDRDELFE